MAVDNDRDFTDYVAARLARWHKTAYVLCGDGHRADDIVQATVTSLYLNWRRVLAADNIDAYVHRMLVHQFLAEKRRPWSRVLLIGQAPERPSPAQDRFADADVIHTALRTLPRGQRAVLVLRFLCDLSVEESATALGCSTGNVKAQTSRALEAMRAYLGQTLPPPRITTTSRRTDGASNDQRN